jgi:hypothetical protein
LYISLNISIFLPRASSSLYISVKIYFQIAISWCVLYSMPLSAQVYVQIQSDDPLYPPHKELCPYYSVIPPHTGLCPLLQWYPYTNSYVPYCSVQPPHKELFPPTVIVSLHIQSCNLFLHIKSYVPYCSVKPPHTGLCPLRQCYPHINSYVPYCSVKPPHKELFPLL